MGCTVAGVESNLDLFDLFVNIPAAEISVAPHARGAYIICLLNIT